MALFNRFKKNKAEAKPAKEKMAAPPLKSEMKEPVKKPEVKANPEVKTVKKSSHGDKSAYWILIKPLVTEKATALAAANKYVFAVAPKAGKAMIKKAIEELYGVRPVGVNILNQRGKNVRHGRTAGRTKSWKKAIVALKAGETIKVFDV